MINPNMVSGAGPEQQDMTDRRRAMTRLLMTPNVPMEAYRTQQGAAMGGGAQVIQGLAQNPEFMKWLSGAFGGGAPGALPTSSIGRVAGPV